MADHEPELDAILEKIRAARNFDFRNYKKATIRRRIKRRMTDRRCRTYAAYSALLDREGAEYDALIKMMLIKVTSFFRDGEAWDALRDNVVPRLLERKKPGAEVRVWCAGCATGEEAYSVAIMLAEALGSSLGEYDIKVFGTDVDEAALAAARRGIYKAQQLDGASPEQIERWFIPVPEGYAVRKEVRRMVVFGLNNLVSDAPISRLDVLLCRNVFIYLDARLQQRALARFHYALRRGGLLVLGKSELIPYAAKLFEAVDLGRRIYRKTDGREASVPERLAGLLEQDHIRAEMQAQPESAAPVSHPHRDAVGSLPVPVIATALDGSILMWNVAATRLWSRSEPEVIGKKLHDLGLPGLSGDLLVERTAAVRMGRSERESAEGMVARPSPAAPLAVRVDVSPLHDVSRKLYGLLYLVNDVASVKELKDELSKAVEARQKAIDELQTTNEELQNANEELETTNEELQSANEELQTTNEELQSSNEELETTNEEMQSTNAELDATNRELAHRTEEMNLLSFYQRTIIRTLSAAVVVLDPNGRITIWNLAAERLLGLMEGEALGQFLWNLNVPALDKKLVLQIRRVLGKKVALRLDHITYPLPTGGRGHASLAAIPLIDDDASLGAVILFEDWTRAIQLVRETGPLPPQANTVVLMKPPVMSPALVTAVTAPVAGLPGKRLDGKRASGTERPPRVSAPRRGGRPRK